MTGSATSRSFEYWVRSSKHAWRPTLLSSVLNPVLYLAALGVGLGALVDRSDPGGLGGVAYLTFVAPGLLAATAMQIAAAEASQPVRSAFQWTKAYHEMLATPLDVRDVLNGTCFGSCCGSRRAARSTPPSSPRSARSTHRGRCWHCRWRC